MQYIRVSMFLKLQQCFGFLWSKSESTTYQRLNVSQTYSIIQRVRGRIQNLQYSSITVLGQGYNTSESINQYKILCVLNSDSHVQLLYGEQEFAMRRWADSLCPQCNELGSSELQTGSILNLLRVVVRIIPVVQQTTVVNIFQVSVVFHVDFQ